MKQSIAILLILTASILAQASSEFIDSNGKSLDRRSAVVALAKGEKVFKLQEITLGAKGTIHAIKKAAVK